MGIEEVMRALSISGPYAYRVIRMLNSEMEQKGYTTIKGKVSQKYFCEHFHCGDGAPQTRGLLMPAYMNEKTGSWHVRCYYGDIDGNRRHKVKRGFATRDEALAWEAEFLASADGSMSMPFEAFVKRYSEDVRPRLKLNTWLTKEHIIRTKIVPFFESKRMRDITPPQRRGGLAEQDVGLLRRRGEAVQRTINNQLNAIFNHAVKYYGLGRSPATPTIKIGERKGSEMRFWTKEQYLMFSEEIIDKPASFYAFEILYWCGLRVGDLLALEPDDIDLKRYLIHVIKSYQRIKRRDVITSPKTPKSKRDVVMPESLADELADLLESILEERRVCRIFCFTKNYLHYEVKRGCAVCDLESIRIHDIRHSHILLLIEMGFSPLAIADRLGHETYEMTLRYAHLFPSKQSDMAAALDRGRRP